MSTQQYSVTNFNFNQGNKGPLPILDPFLTKGIKPGKGHAKNKESAASN